MQKIVLALAFGVAAAFVPSQVRAPAATTVVSETKEDLIALAEALPGPPGFWDPLGLADQSFEIGWPDELGNANLGNEGTIGWLRHAEIKHGRVAMAAFLGFIAQCTPVVKGEHLIAPYRDYVAGVTPQEQWDNMPLVAKLQIFVAIGMLESYGEGAGNDDFVHYTKGGQPGYYPSIKGKGPRWTDKNGKEQSQITFDLYDPFNFGFREKSAEARARGLKSEILNGRAAMIGIMGFISESRVPGSVPGLAGIPGFPHTDIDTMAPFAKDFSFFSS